MKFLCLGIESSCDDSSAAIVGSDKNILSNIVISQTNEHLPYKGVVPEIASRAHMNYLDFAIKEAIKEAQVSLNDIACIAATGGPGLIGGVIVGTMFAKSIASVLKKPYIAINHLEGHALTARLTSDLDYPYLLLLVSGGHCQFYSILELGKYILLGETQDDALGEAFDKVAKMLGLDYPGGPVVEERAKNGDPRSFKLPKSMCDRLGCDMSFSGLKTAIRLIIEKECNISEEFINNICASFQYTATEIIKYKINEAIKQHQQLTSSRNIVLSGGVAANQYIIKELTEFLGNKNYILHSPPIKLCTDNAAMIAWAGIERYNRSMVSSLSFCPIARWPLNLHK